MKPTPEQQLELTAYGRRRVCAALANACRRGCAHRADALRRLLVASTRKYL